MKNENPDNFPEIVTALIDDFGLPPMELALKASTALASIYRWKNGTAKPHKIVREKILSIYEREKKKREKE